MGRPAACRRIASTTAGQRPARRRRAPGLATRTLALAAVVLAALTVLPLVPGVSAAGLPQGDGALAYQIRSVHTSDPTVSRSTTTEQDLGLLLSQDLPDYGVLLAEAHRIDPADDGSEVGWTGVTLTGVRLRSTTLAVGLGDSVVDASLMSRRFLVFVDPTFDLEGVRLDLASATTSIALFGGEAVARSGSFATAVDRLGQGVAGFRLRQRLGSRTTLSGLYLHTDGGGVVGAGRVPARNESAGAGVDLHLFGALSLLGEVRYATRTAVDGASAADSSGLSYIAGPLYDRPGLRLEAAVFSLDPAYVPVERAIASADQRGAYGAFNWDAGRSFGLFGSAVRSRNNLAGASSLTTLETTQLILGSRGLVPAAWPILVLLRGELTFLESRSSPGTPVESTGTSLFAEVSQVIGTWRPVLRSRVVRLDDRLRREAATTVDVTAELWWQVTRRARLWAAAQWVDASEAATLPGATRYLGRIGGEQRISAALFVRGEGEVTCTTEAGATSTRTGASASLGYQHRVFSLFVDLRRNWTDSDSPASRRIDDVAYARLVVPLRWGRPAPMPIGRSTGELASGWGTIEGQVFTDLDGDGRRGSGESGLAGLRVILDGLPASAIETDHDGRYRFTRVAAGPHSVRLEVRRLPADYDLVSPQLVTVTVEQRGKHTADFVVQPLGQVAGRIRRVRVLGDGRLEPGDAGSVSLFLRRGEEVRQTFSDADGRFAFDNVRAGEYELLVDPAALPEGVTVEQASRLVTVGIGQRLDDLDFTLHEPARPEVRGSMLLLPPAGTPMPAAPRAAGTATHPAGSPDSHAPRPAPVAPGTPAIRVAAGGAAKSAACRYVDSPRLVSTPACSRSDGSPECSGSCASASA